MCKRIVGTSDGVDLGYKPYLPYMFSFNGDVEITDKGYEIECWEKGKWINLGKAVAIEAGCPFRIVRATQFEPSPHCTVIDIDRVKVVA